MRTKIIAGNLVAVLLVGLASWAMMWGQLRASYTAELQERISRDAGLLERVWSLTAREFVEGVETQAADRRVVGVYDAPNQDLLRSRAYEQANRVSRLFGQGQQGPAGEPEIVYVVSDQGRVLARDHDPNRDFDLDLRPQLQTLAAVFDQGVSQNDVWVWTGTGQPKLLEVAMAPVRNPEGIVVGALVVGYELSVGFDRTLGEAFGDEIVVLREGAIYSSTLEPPMADALGESFFGEGATLGDAVQRVISNDDSAPVGPWEVTLGGNAYVGVLLPIPLSPSSNAAFAILADRSAETAQANMVHAILALTLIGVAIVLIYGFLIGTSFLRPIEEMEEGILAAINGRTDLRLDIQSQELGGLAYRINQLLNVVTDTPESDEDGRISTAPGMMWVDDTGPATPKDLPPPNRRSDGPAVDADEAARLAAEPEAAYYARVYREYVAAKSAVGEDVSNVAEDRFTQRLKANEQSLIRKHGCRMVRFQVHTRGTQVNLRPVIIR